MLLNPITVRILLRLKMFFMSKILEANYKSSAFVFCLLVCFFVFWAKTFTSIVDTCTNSASLLSRLKTLHWHQLLWLGVRSSLNSKKNYTHTQTELRFWPLQRRHGVKKKKKKKQEGFVDDNQLQFLKLQANQID